MQASSFSSSIIPPKCFSGRPPRRRARIFLTTKVRASAEDEDTTDRGREEPYRGLVDENMLTLRKRIKEIKALDKGDTLHEDWLEWEKDFYCKLYESEVMEMLGLLQLHLTSERPRLTMGMTVMVTLSVPTSVLVVMLHLMDMANWILGGVQLK